MNTATETMAATQPQAPSSFKMIRTLGGIALISGVLLTTCGPGDDSPGGKLDLRFARQPIDGPCPESVAEDPAPPAFQEQSGPAGRGNRPGRVPH